jgi:hypothetical protein
MLASVTTITHIPYGDCFPASPHGAPALAPTDGALLAPSRRGRSDARQ